MARACRIRCFVFNAAQTNYQPSSVLFLNSCYVLFGTITKYTQYVGEVTDSFLFILLTNKPKPIEEGIQKG